MVIWSDLLEHCIATRLKAGFERGTSESVRMLSGGEEIVGMIGTSADVVDAMVPDT